MIHRSFLAASRTQQLQVRRPTLSIVPTGHDGTDLVKNVSAARSSAKGEARRPWCPATRIEEHREAEAISKAADAAKAAGGFSWDKPSAVQRRTDFGPLNVRCKSAISVRTPGTACGLIRAACWSQVDSDTRQTNEGKWPFTFTESADGKQLIFTVKCTHNVESTDILVDLHPTIIRVLIKVS